ANGCGANYAGAVLGAPARAIIDGLSVRHSAARNNRISAYYVRDLTRGAALGAVVSVPESSTLGSVDGCPWGDCDVYPGDLLTTLYTFTVPSNASTAAAEANFVLALRGSGSWFGAIQF